ncbi:DUF3883 domain-containing protein [Azospirillum sp. HJ39]|uniref:protein NO VEIN domain-containing protein n=1 Tax=Azospirillum sp. HJ39 TaxID=3159496 RepID=UPI003557EAB7
MALFIKCSAPAVTNGILIFQGKVEKDTRLEDGDPVFIWSSETKGGIGLAMKGHLKIPASATKRSTLTVEISNDKPKSSLTNDRLDKERDQQKLPPGLWDKVRGFAHQRAVALDPDEAAYFDSYFTESASWSIDNAPIVLLHGIGLTRYDGTLDGFVPGGFKFAVAHGYGHEVFNFKPYRGRCYGYMEIPGRENEDEEWIGNSLSLEKVGADRGDASVGGVLAVWTAPDPERRGRIVVGWYKNATLYRTSQTPQGQHAKARIFEEDVCTYRVSAKAEDCRLLTPEERVLLLPGGGVSDMPGRSNIFYLCDKEAPIARKLEKRLRAFIKGDTVEPTAKPLPIGTLQQDLERRKKIEKAAVDLVWSHFEDLDYTIEDLQKYNVGYDLRAIRGDEVLCIEVKGRSGTDVIADFTVNEYNHINMATAGKYPNGDSYRICIVTDALTEGPGSELHHFRCWRQKGEDVEWRRVDGTGRLIFEDRVAARGSISED